MDRSYRAPDLVHVYQSDRDEPLLGTFTQVPYSLGGYDYYLYKGRLYYAYDNLENGKAYILLTKAVPVHGGIYIH